MNPPHDEYPAADNGTDRRLSGWRSRLLRLTSLRLRLVAVFAAVALAAAVSASGIAYWLNRDAVLTRAQNAALNDFRASMTRNAGSCRGTRPATNWPTPRAASAPAPRRTRCC